MIEEKMKEGEKQRKYIRNDRRADERRGKQRNT